MEDQAQEREAALRRFEAGRQTAQELLFTAHDELTSAEGALELARARFASARKAFDEAYAAYQDYTSNWPKGEYN